MDDVKRKYSSYNPDGQETLCGDGEYSDVLSSDDVNERNGAEMSM